MSSRRLRVGLRLSVALLLIAMAAGSALLLERMRGAARTAATEGLEQAARAAEAAVNRHFLQVDSTLAGLPALLRTAAGGAGLEPAVANAVLRDLNVQNLVFRDVLLVQPGGRLWATSLASTRQAGLPLDPKLLEAPPIAGSLSVVGPMRNPQTSEWSLFFARPMRLPGVGRVIAAIEVPVQLVTGLLTPMGDAARVRISLERADGQLLASVPHDEAGVGHVSPRPANFRADGIAFETRAAAGAPATIEVVRTALYRGIQVRVSRSLEDALGGFARDRQWLLIGVAGAAALLVCFAIAMDIALRQRERMDAERARARAVLENAIEAMPDGFVMWDAEDRLVTCNSRFRHLYAASADLLVPGARFEDVLRGGALRGQYPQCGPDVDAFVQELLAWRSDDSPALERLLPDGRWLLVSERPTSDGGHVGIRTDITPIKRAMADLAAATSRAEEASAEAKIQGARFHTALDNMSQGLCMVGPDARVIVCNRRFAAIFGLTAEAAAPGTPFDALFAQVRVRAGPRSRLVRSIYERQRMLAMSSEAGDFLVEEPERALAVAHRPMASGGWVATYEDATERTHAEAQVRFLAHHDSLTRLPNRVLFRDRLEQAIREADLAADGDGVALLCLDLDRFKQVNDTLGHPAGDELLVSAAQRLRSSVRDSDFVARLGGDEFAILHRSTRLPDSAEALARRIIDTLGAPYDIAGNRAVVGVSVGIAVAGGEGAADADALMKNADVALYRAKSVGRGTFCRYDAAMGSAALRRVGLEAELRDALAREQFRLVYQPVRDLGTGRICGFEALVRWSHPGLGQVSPAEFIPLAEETGLILPLGESILRTACAAAASWPRGMRLAVNLSPVQLRSPGLAGMVAGALDAAGLEPGRLELEITETALLQESEDALAVLRELQAMGVSIALDDFGTGYSSLRHLTSLPVDRIKIDRSFVLEIGSRADCRAVVSSVASLARQLGLATTAEGVETAEQLRLVHAAGCTEAQGYFISKPLAVGDAQALLADDHARRANAA